MISGVPVGVGVGVVPEIGVPVGVGDSAGVGVGWFEDGCGVVVGSGLSHGL